MAVLKQTSPTAWPSAPRPKPSSTVPSASTRSAVGTRSGQAEAFSGVVMNALHSRRMAMRQSRKVAIHMLNTYIGCLFAPDGLDQGLSGDAARPPARGRKTMLRDDINNAVKDAMRAKDERKLSTLRMVNSTIKNADIAARG